MLDANRASSMPDLSGRNPYGEIHLTAITVPELRLLAC